MTTVAELVARLSADSTNFTATMRKATGDVAALEGQSASFGKVSTIAWGAAGLAAAKAVMDFSKFETTMVRLVTLAGATEAEMRNMSDAILDMAGEVGKGPQELAEGLYFVESAGLKGAAALETLEYAAKASALGMGTVEEIADATTSVLNAYGQENISAAKATGILREAVEQSKREANEMAGAIGRVLPIASEMGVEFEQVAGGIAAMTRTGLDANEAVTALRGLLLGILDPTDRAEETLKKYGLSVKYLQDQLRTGNVVDVLLQLKEAFGKNDRALAEVFPNVRALVGVLSLVGKNADSARAAFEEVMGATAGIDEEFNRLGETTGQTLAEAFASVQAEMIRVGEALAPLIGLVADLLSLASPLIQFLDEALYAFLAMKALTVVAGWLGATALGFKAVSVAAHGTAAAATSAQTAMMKNWSAPALFQMESRLSKVATGLRASAKLIGPALVLGVAEATALFDSFAVSLERVSEETGFSDEFLGTLNSIVGNTNVATESWSGFVAEIDGGKDNMEAFAQQASGLLAGVEALGGSAKDAETAFGAWQDRVAGTDEAWDGSQQSIDAFIDAQTEMIDQLTASGTALGKGKITIQEYTRRVMEYGFSAPAAMAMANQALDEHGKKVQENGVVVTRWAKLSSKALNELRVDFKSALHDSTGDLNGFDKQWGFTGKSIAKTFDQMRVKAEGFAEDMAEFRATSKAKWIPEEFQQYLVDAGPDAIHGFVEATGTAQREMVGDWEAMDKANEDSGAAVDDVTGRVKKFKEELEKIPDRVPVTFDLGLSISEALKWFTGVMDDQPVGGTPDEPTDPQDDPKDPDGLTSSRRKEKQRQGLRAIGDDDQTATTTRRNGTQRTGETKVVGLRITNWREGMAEVETMVDEKLDRYARYG